MKHNKNGEIWIRWMAILSFAVLVLTILPMLYLSFFDYANGDDFNYGALTHQAFLQTGSVWSVLKAAATVVRNTWYLWQGTWSSVFLFSLQPGIWNEKAYGVTVWIALFCILAGSFYLIRIILREKLGMSRSMMVFLWSVLMILTLQFMPNIKTAVFWYTSVAHYIIPYGVSLFLLGWTIHYLDNGKKRYFVGILISMIYLGGAGYPLVVLSLAGVFFLTIGFLIRNKDNSLRKRAAWLCLPFLLEIIGFLISAVAPGNKIRGGEDFGFSLSRVLETVTGGFSDTFLDLWDGITRPELLLPTVISMVFVWLLYQPSEKKAEELPHPLMVVVIGIVIMALVRMPALYAGVDNVSSGVPDTEYAVTMFGIFLILLYCICWAKLKHAVSMKEKSSRRVFLTCVVTILLFGCTAVLSRHSLKSSSDYICIDFIRSGQLADFESQMQERLAILENPTIEDAVVPEMNNEQGPFMHMALLDDPDSYTNYVTALYYGKNSVIAIPREEYEALSMEADE